MGKRGDPSSYGPGRDPHRPPSLGASGGGGARPGGGARGIRGADAATYSARHREQLAANFRRRAARSTERLDGGGARRCTDRVARGGGDTEWIVPERTRRFLPEQIPHGRLWGGASSGGLLRAEGTRGRVASAFRWCTTKELWAVTRCSTCPYERHPHAHTHPYLILFLVSPPTAAPPHLSSSAFPSHQP